MKRLWNARHCLKVFLLLVLAVLTLPFEVAWGGMGGSGSSLLYHYDPHHANDKPKKMPSEGDGSYDYF